MSDTTPLLLLTDIHKHYQMGRDRLEVLRGAHLRVEEGQFVALMGASGSGKSTLLHIAGALDTPDAGSVIFRGQDLAQMANSARHRLRNASFGFVFQFYHLLPELSVLENVLMPVMVGCGVFGVAKVRQQRGVALSLLERFGLGQRLKHRPKELSGGERQRVAIARALMNRPALLLADEPTGNLDSAAGGEIMRVLLELHRDHGQGILLVTHDPAIAALADTTVHLRDGQIAD